MIAESSATIVGPHGGLRRSLSVGDTLGQYQLVGKLGCGGMGDVFVARSLADERVALKCIKKSAESTPLVRFKREFRIIDELQHPNLVSPGELRVADGWVYYTMELVEGADFITHVRAERDPSARMARLLRAATQLVEAVCHIHDAGYVHRDIKPSNVLVTAEGRVVVLDFGLVFELSTTAFRVSRTNQWLGTPAYMAPEQFDGQCREPADLYAVGVMLFEILYGRRPLLGSTAQLVEIKRKRSHRVEIPDEPAYPERLRELVGGLLALEPWQRPRGREVLAILHGLQIGSEPSVELPLSELRPAAEARPLIGRARELEELMQAHFSSVARQRPVYVRVLGPRGIGKTSLLGRFAEAVRERSDRTLILRGRCLEHESVPYRGVDEVVDSLSVFLRRLPQSQLLCVQPRHPGALGRLFPVLAKLWPSEVGAEHAPSEQRDEGVLALRELLVRVADRWRLIVVIDDFHRADEDGRRVLAELLRPPDAPALTLVVSADEGLSTLEDRCGAVHESHMIELGPLAEPEARSLVETALVAAGAAPDQIPAMSAEILGHGVACPATLIQRVLDLTREGSTSQESLEAVGARVTRLPKLAREVLECVAIAGAPVRVAVVAAVLGEPELGDAINLLCSEGLASRSNISKVDISHPVVRAAVLELIEAPRSQAMHGRLAAALAELGAAPEALIEHLCAAGQREQALAQILVAAGHALRSLAFAQAIDLYRRGLELLEPGSPRQGELERELAQTLAHDGRGLEAGRLYLQIASSCADPSEGRELRRQAALLLLSSGRMREGLERLCEVLRELGEELPSHPVWLAASLVLERQRVARAWSRWRGGRTAGPMDAVTCEIVETLLVAVRGLGAQEHVLTYLLQSRALRMALGHEPSLALALLVGTESVVELARGRARRSQQRWAAFEELAAQFKSDELDVLYQGLCVVSSTIELDFDQVTQDGPRVWMRLASQPTARWFRSVLCAPLALAWLYTGDFNTLRRECERWRRAAIEHGDHLRVVEVSSSLAIVSLYGGDVERSRELLEQIEGSIDTTMFSMSAAAARIALATVLAYEGRHEEALRLCKKTVRQSRRTGLLALRLVRCILEDLRGRCELAQLLAAGHEAPILGRRRVARRIGWLREHGEVMGRGLAAVLQAGLACLDGREVEAYGAWRDAEREFASGGCVAHQAVVRQRLGALGEDPGSEALRERARSYFEIQGVCEPHRFVDLLAPGELRGVAAGPRQRSKSGAP